MATLREPQGRQITNLNEYTLRVPQGDANLRMASTSFAS